MPPKKNISTIHQSSVTQKGTSSLNAQQQEPQATTNEIEEGLTPSPPAEKGHLFLSAAQVSRAKSVFLSYCQSQNVSPYANVGTSNPASSTSSSFQPLLNAKGVQMFLRDLGVTVTESEAKDMIFTLNQPTSVQIRNREAEKSFSGGVVATGRSSIPSGRAAADEERQDRASPSSPGPSNTNNTNSNSASNSNDYTLNFSLFLELLMKTFPQDHMTRETDCEMAFRVLDVNDDQELTESDIRSVVERLLAENPKNPDIRALANMTKEQLMRVVSDADVDGDGRVTLDDFIHVVNTA